VPSCCRESSSCSTTRSDTASSATCTAEIHQTCCRWTPQYAASACVATKYQIMVRSAILRRRNTVLCSGCRLLCTALLAATALLCFRSILSCNMHYCLAHTKPWNRRYPVIAWSQATCIAVLLPTIVCNCSRLHTAATTHSDSCMAACSPAASVHVQKGG
jgi:hypothetical protein